MLVEAERTRESRVEGREGVGGLEVQHDKAEMNKIQYNTLFMPTDMQKKDMEMSHMHKQKHTHTYTHVHDIMTNVLDLESVVILNHTHS